MFQENLFQGMIAPMDDVLEAGPLAGKVVLITGASSGIGWQATHDFCAGGAVVIGLGRAAERCAQAQERICAEQADARIHFVLADLSRQAEVRRAAAEIRQWLAAQGFDHIDVLINNAGTYAGKMTLTEDGIELTFAVNHLAPFLLTHELRDLLCASGDGRVLTVSSGSHYHTWLNLKRIQRPLLFNGLWAYKTAKLCNVLFSAEFNLRYAGLPVRAYAVDPGLVNTEIGFKDTGLLSRTVWKLRGPKGSHPGVPVRTMLFLAQIALAPGENQYNTGKDIYWKDSQPKAPSRAARNPRLAADLWQLSSRLCGLK